MESNVHDRDRCETLEEKAFKAFVSCKLTADNNDAVHDLLRTVGEVQLPIMTPSQRVRLEWSSPDKYVEVEIIDGTIVSWFFRDSVERRTRSDGCSTHRDLVDLIAQHFPKR